MPQLDPSLFATQLFWLFVTFMALFLVAWKVVLPRITEVRNARRNRIDGDLEKAEALKSEAEEVAAAYEKVLAEATAQAQEIHRAAAHALTEERTRRQDVLSRRLSAEAREAEARILSEKQQAVEDIRSASRDVVQQAAARLIGVEVAEADAERAIGAALEEQRS